MSEWLENLQANFVLLRLRVLIVAVLFIIFSVKGNSIGADLKVRKCIA